MKPWIHAAAAGALALTALVAGVADAQTRFRLPFDDPKGGLFLRQPIIGMDHDPVDRALQVECVNYAGEGFPACYDQHRGTDFLLAGSFGAMDTLDVKIVAAADGVVTRAVDGNYDRCHGTQGLQISCDGHPVRANLVELRHADGMVSRYLHMKKGSVKVTDGQQVRCGDLLGYVGSSGSSAFPHLHFEVRTKAGGALDPYAGPRSQKTSYWVQQDGPFGRPAPRCAGDPPAPDGGVATDSGSAGDAAVGGDGGADASTPRGGCAVGGVSPTWWPALVLWLAYLMLIRFRSRPAG